MNDKDERKHDAMILQSFHDKMMKDTRLTLNQ
ncbi:hypothetical protein SAMN05444371_0895 [Epilithonimonas mollis]|uniref:Uncharacterized protein n=1 Tax=Epilithonimonas mollis TaxID=216903 RepID=A0A1M6P6Q1_9FLAO|nr:hypothetical protein SAMN05444371_0895 [Epilithonimonas mollis]